MLSITVTGKGLVRFHDAVRALGDAKAKRAYAMALNKTAGKVNTQVKRAVAAQMGVTQQTIIKRGALRRRPATVGNLEATIDASGKHLPLKDFRPVQRKKGVSAKPWGRQHLFGGTWIDRGRAAKTGIGPNTRAAAGGHVFKNTGGFNKKSGRFNAIESLWGPAVPKEIVKGESERAFYRVARTELPIEVRRAITVVTKGSVS